jgi:crotonobetainyl-CoA:carnitine CoA-transferase CaiB-like acyl-CoA transferase
MGAGENPYFVNLNRNKRDIAVDLKTDEGKEIIHRPAASADVVVENFRPGVMRRLGFDWPALAAVNSKLVYCSISGYGQSGEGAGRAAYAPIVQAASGYELANQGYQDGLERPLKSGIFTADYLTGVHAFGAICAALVRRASGGEGAYVDCALLDAMLGMLAYEVVEAQVPQKQRRPIYRPTRARDGFLIVMPVSPANFADMARAAGRPDWTTDARFATHEARVAHWDALMDELDAWAAGKSAAECEHAMTRQGVPCSRYFSVGEVIASPHAAERGMLAPAIDGAGPFLAPSPPYRMAGATGGGRVPALGEHNATVLGDFLGRSAAQIAQLEKDAVLCRPR